jgi:hypothetical protein
MAPRSRTKPAGREKNRKKQAKAEEKSQATIEDFDREGLGIAPKE